MATRPCETCKLYVFDEYGEMVLGRDKKPLSRGGFDPPCRTCPKQSPAKAHEFELTEKNWRALAFYRKVKATNGACLTVESANDKFVSRNLMILDRIFMGHERKLQSDSLVNGLTQVLLQKK